MFNARRSHLDFVERVWPSLTLSSALALSESLSFSTEAVPSKILVVEDELLIVQTLKFNLEHLGYNVATAADGRRAIDVAVRERPDLILMDVMLPLLNGFEACAVIRSRMNVPVIMLTARDSEKDKLLAFEAGAKEYVTKPFVLHELLERIAACLTPRETGESGT
ncbi:MAG: hypothetical protein NVSMB31_19270 [Vulcanimicrobiaceae bacterium]